MIERYTRAEMAQVWAPEQRFSWMLKVEIAVAEVQASLKMIPQQAASAIREKAKFDLGRIAEIEKTTKHDVIAFVSNCAENIGESGRYLHFAMTSSDILDTALSLQIDAACEVLMKSTGRLEAALKIKIETHAEDLCAGRTHGMFAEITSFGFKLMGHWAELKRHQGRIENSRQQMKIAKLSGAVGTYSNQSEQVEIQVAKKLGLRTETLATQVIPRDRHADLMCSVALLGGGLERLAVELRHLQRSEVSEVVEGFSPGQKGSSAMPHKKNPISAENITGLARLLRSYAQAALENQALWHERDISHSSVERVIFPDAFLLADYAVDRMASLIEGLFVDQAQMLKNIESSGGQIFSSQVLLHLVAKGLSRELAYQHVQRLCHALKPGENLRQRLETDKDTALYFGAADLNSIFNGESLKKSNRSKINQVFASYN